MFKSDTDIYCDCPFLLLQLVDWITNASFAQTSINSSPTWGDVCVEKADWSSEWNYSLATAPASINPFPSWYNQSICYSSAINCLTKSNWDLHWEKEKARLTTPFKPSPHRSHLLLLPVWVSVHQICLCPRVFMNRSLETATPFQALSFWKSCHAWPASVDARQPGRWIIWAIDDHCVCWSQWCFIRRPVKMWSCIFLTV